MKQDYYATEPSLTIPVELKKLAEKKQFRITWQDGHISVYAFQYLRQNCPCAACRDEWSGVRTLNPNTISSDVDGLLVNLVGNYALHISFSDYHSTGIYSFTYLRKICPCSECRTGVSPAKA